MQRLSLPGTRAVFSLLLANILLIGAASAQNLPTFSAATPYATGAEPQYIATADLNGDGIPDLITGNRIGNSITVLLGNGDGTFRRAADYPAGTEARQVVVGDLNGDGIPDVVVASDNAITVLMGKGDGTLISSHAVAAGAQHVALGDFNGDKKLDLALATGKLVILYGNGDGTFQSPQDVTPAGAFSVSNLVSGDFDGNGATDIAYSDCCDPQTEAAPVGHLGVLFNDGTGKFTNWTKTEAEVIYMVVGDFNADGISDVGVSWAGCHTPCEGLDIDAGSKSLALDTIGTFQVPDFLDNIPGPATAADFNGDGKIDIGFPASDTQPAFGPNQTTHDAFFIYPATAAGQWSTTFADVNLGPPQGSFGSYSVAADFNNDGRPDIAVTDRLHNQILVALNTSSGFQQDFTLSISPKSATIPPGQSATYTVSVAPQGGFNAAVNLSCSGLPAGAACAFNPASVTPSSGAATSMLTLTTSAAKTGALSAGPLFATLLPFAGLTLLTAGSGRRKRWLQLLLILAMAATLVLFIACGGGGSRPSSNPSPTPNTGGNGGGTPTPGSSTPAGQYTVTIIAASGSTQHTNTVMLNVQ